MVTRNTTYTELATNEVSTPKQLKTLSDRLRYALERKHLRKSDLARELGVKHQVIQYLCENNAKHSKFSYQLADILGINPSWLISGHGPFEIIEHNQTASRAIPILNKDQIIALANQSLTLDDPSLKTTTTDLEGANDYFSYEINDQSMFPRIEQGTSVTILLSQTPKAGDIVLAYIRDTSEVICRQYAYEKNKKVELIPYNKKSFKTLLFNRNDKILGIVKEAKWKL